LKGPVLRALLDRALGKARDARQLAVLQRQLRETGRLGDLVGGSKPMQEVMRIVEMAAPSSASVLITGETGRARRLWRARCTSFRPRQRTVCGHQLFGIPRRWESEFLATNGPLARGESLCNVRATISLPDPVSPVISTDASSCGHLHDAHHFLHRLRPADEVAQPSRSRIAVAAPPIARISRLAQRAVQQRAQYRPFNGFSMYQNAPASIAATARSSLPLPVIIMAGTSWSSGPSCLSKSSPFIPGNSTSAISVSGW